MKKRSDENRDTLHDKINGPGEKATRKSYYPELQRRLAELEKKNQQLTREIEDRIKIEEELRESQERLTAIFEASPDPVVVYDKQGLVEYLNPAFERVFGWTYADLRGKKIPFVPPEEEPITTAKIKEIFSTQKPVSFDTRRLTAEDDIRDIHIQAAIIKGADQSSSGMVVILTDMTETRKLEFQLQSAQRMEALGTLAGGIAHDFNNLLMGVLGNATLLLYDKEPASPEYAKLKSIEQYVMDGSKLTRQLLGIAKGGKYEVKPADMNAIIKKSSGMFGRTKKEIRIHRKYQNNVWTVIIDTGQIEQVLLNLYVNAWQAMPEGGNLYLQTANVCLDEDSVKIFNVEPGNYVRISVTDTGVGIDAETRQRIFDPFFTTKQMGRGTGLGLASAYGIIRNHGGFINVYSQIGEGTSFNIYLPASEDAVAPEQVPLQETVRGSGTVLLVDDEEMIIEVGREMLQKLGYTVMTALGGSDALATYRKNRESIGMVILDMIMPDMGGGAIYKRLKEENPGIRVLLSSGYSINGMASDILSQGCNGFIQKPFNLRDLSIKVKEILDQG